MADHKPISSTFRLPAVKPVARQTETQDSIKMKVTPAFALAGFFVANGLAAEDLTPEKVEADITTEGCVSRSRTSCLWRNSFLAN